MAPLLALLAFSCVSCVKSPSAAAGDGDPAQAAPSAPPASSASSAPSATATPKAPEPAGAGAGLYTEKPELSAYVQSVGTKVVPRAKRAGRDYRFDILDSGDVNVFSEESGHVYVTRALLARMSSEDEMAAALGREIAYSGGSKESAGSESEAVGLKYARDAGYSPRGAADLLRTLATVRTAEPARLERWLAGHSGSAARLANLDAELARMKEAAGKAIDRPLKRDPYLRRIDGIAVGWVGPSGSLKGARYTDIRRDFSILVPEGWTIEPQEAALVLLRPSDDLRAEVAAPANLRPGVSGDAALDFARRAPEQGYEVTKPVGHAALPIGDAAIVTLHRKDESGAVTSVRKMFQVRFDRLYVVTLVVPVEREEETLDLFMKLTGSIKWLTPQEAVPPSVPRMSLETVKTGESWKSLAQESLGGDWRAAALAAWNGRDATEAPSPGMLIKIPPQAVFE